MYGVDRDVYDGLLYDGLNAFAWDVPFYLRQARRARGPVLELCCGTGRITLPLAKAGVDVTGADFTPSMLRRAREKAVRAGLRVRFVKGDMRTLRLRRKFALVFIPFNSLQNTYTLSDVEKVFATVRAHLRRGGRFVFDVFNPSLRYMIEGERFRRGKYRFRLEDGRRAVIDEVCRYDAAGQVNRVTWTHRVDGVRARPQRLDMRCFYPLELEALLKYNGFRIVRRYGDFKGASFSSSSPKQIFVCEAAR